MVGESVNRGSLFDGEHIFAVEPIDGGKTRFVQRELFSGLLVPLLRKMIYRS
jgi:hypothetical protein